MYENVHLKIALNESLPEKHFVFMATVNWYEYKIKIFQNYMCFDQNVCYYEGFFKIFSQKIMDSAKLLEILLFESFLFVKRRGISIHSKEQKKHKDWSTISSLCSCASAFGQCQRLADLGYYNEPNCCFTKKYAQDMAYFDNSGRGADANNGLRSISVMEVMKEIGINISCNHRIPRIMKTGFFLDSENAINIFDACIKYGNFQFSVDSRSISNFGYSDTMVNLEQVNISHPSCSAPKSILCMADVIKTIEVMNPEPFQWTIWDKTSENQSNHHGSPEYCRKLKILREIDGTHFFRNIARKVLVYETSDKDNKMNEKVKLLCIFYPLPSYEKEMNVEPADADIKNIWKEAGCVLARGSKNKSMCTMASELGQCIENIVQTNRKTKLKTIDASLFVPVYNRHHHTPHQKLKKTKF